MSALPSIQRRLLSHLAVMGVVWSLSALLVVGLVVRHEVNEVLDQGLKESAEIIYGVVQLNRAALASAEGGSMAAPPHAEPLVWQLLDGGAAVVLRSHRAPSKALTQPARSGFSTVSDWRIYALPISPSGNDDAKPPRGNPPVWLIVAQELSERDDAKTEALLYPGLATALIGLLAVAWLRRSTRQELQPLAELARQVHEHDPLDRDHALPSATREELAPVHRAISELSHRLAQRIAREQAFSAHAAHALRTPLASIMANLAAAQQRAQGAESNALLQRSRDAARRLRSVVSALLTLFRSGSQLHLETLSLSTLVRQLPFDAMDVVVEDAAADAPALVADADLLAAALSNLLDNAVRHGARRATVRASVGAPGTCCVEVHDDGQGMSATQKAAFQAALDAEDYAALPGLGLMLADLVARAHGGRCTLGEDAAGSESGARVIMSFRLPSDMASASASASATKA